MAAPEPPDLADRLGFEEGKDIAGGQKEAAFAERMVEGMKEGEIKTRRPQSDPKGEDTHMLDARIGEQPLVVGLIENKDRRQQHGNQSEDEQDITGKIGLAGGDADLVGAQNGQEGAVEQDAGEQRRNRRGGLAVSVRQPGVHRSEPHLGAIADEEKDESDARQPRIQCCAPPDQRIE